ncbi:MAG: PIN domain-containing protein [Mangrovibacterium sp.]|nr:PIN domain-containing protein [Mangrovibacterium sp.]
MKRIFLDANVLVSVLNKEYPLFSYSSRILGLAETKDVELFTSPVCLSIAFYFAEKKSGTKNALKKIHLLVSKINIADTDKKVVIMASQNKAIRDFEDGLEYYSAVNAGCECLVTENTGDFYFSKIDVMRSQQFLEQFLLN